MVLSDMCMNKTNLVITHQIIDKIIFSTRLSTQEAAKQAMIEFDFTQFFVPHVSCFHFYNFMQAKQSLHW